MLIYSHNLPDKLFGFALSRDFLKYNTDLCAFVDDPNLTLDIDLAVDLNKAVRGDADAATRLTNTLILSSSYIDITTSNFYVKKMKQYPIFDYDVARINYIFSLDNPRGKGSNTDENDFIDKLLNAFKDCLNSPCNLFNQTSDSVASMASVANKMNSTTMPTFSGLKDSFVNAFGGISQTVFKKVPTAVQSTITELTQLGQQAYTQSVDMVYAKDPKTREELVKKALAGQPLTTNAKGYRYVPDLQSYFNTSKMSSNILTKVAQELGGCYGKFQQAYRYEPYNPEHNLSTTSRSPVNNKVGDTPYQTTLFGKTNHDFNRSNGDLSVCYAQIQGRDGQPTGSVASVAKDPEVQKELRAVAAKLGVSVEALEAVIQLESGWRVTESTGSYTGLAQLNSASFMGRQDLWEKYINGSPADQISAWGEYLGNSKNLTTIRNSTGLGSYTTAEQAAILQATQFAPQGSNTGVNWANELLNGNKDVRTTRSNQPQAKVLGSTSINDMARYYSGN